MAQAPKHAADRAAFVREIVPDPKAVPDVTLLYGYLGASSEDGHERLYLSPDLTNYVEVPTSAIMHHMPAPKEQDPHGGVTLWVKKDAALVYKMAPAADALAHYFAGAIQAGAAAAPQPTPAVTIGCATGQVCQPTVLGPGCHPTIAGPACPTRFEQNCPTNQNTICHTCNLACHSPGTPCLRLTPHPAASCPCQIDTRNWPCSQNPALCQYVSQAGTCVFSCINTCHGLQCVAGPAGPDIQPQFAQVPVAAAGPQPAALDAQFFGGQTLHPHVCTVQCNTRYPYCGTVTPACSYGASCWCLPPVAAPAMAAQAFAQPQAGIAAQCIGGTAANVQTIPCSLLCPQTHAIHQCGTFHTPCCPILTYRSVCCPVSPFCPAPTAFCPGSLACPGSIACGFGQQVPGQQAELAMARGASGFCTPGCSPVCTGVQCHTPAHPCTPHCPM
jgi:hypothetical protein